MSYDPKTKIIELEKVDIGGDVFYLTSKEKKDLKLCVNVSKMNKLKDKKVDLIIVLITGVVILLLAIWVIYDTLNVISFVFIYVLPIVLLIKCILVMFLPPKPKIVDLEHYKKMNRLRASW